MKIEQAIQKVRKNRVEVVWGEQRLKDRKPGNLLISMCSGETAVDTLPGFINPCNERWGTFDGKAWFNLRGPQDNESIARAIAFDETSETFVCPTCRRARKFAWIQTGEEKVSTHYGVPVSTGIPVPGVFSVGDVDFLFDLDMDNVLYQEHIAGCKKDEHDLCHAPEHTHEWLGGFTLVGEGDEKNIAFDVSEIYSRVFSSQWVISCNLCSPFYPGQGDVDFDGEYLAYSFPPDTFEKENPLLKRIVHLSEVVRRYIPENILGAGE
jgi:rubredoxin